MCIISRLEKFISGQYGKFRVGSVKRRQRKHPLFFDEEEKIKEIVSCILQSRKILREEGTPNGGERGETRAKENNEREGSKEQKPAVLQRIVLQRVSCVYA